MGLGSARPQETRVWLLKAFSHARLPCDRFAYGGQDHGKVFLLDERG